MLCMLVKLLITSSTLSSVRDDRRDILLLPATPLHHMQAQFSIILQSVNLRLEVEVGSGASGATWHSRLLISDGCDVAAGVERARQGVKDCLT